MDYNHYYTNLFKNDYVKYYVAKGDHNYVAYVLNLLENKRESNLYDIAICNNDRNMVNALIKCYVAFNEYTFKIAMQNDDMDILKLLLENNCPIHDEDHYMVHAIVGACNVN